MKVESGQPLSHYRLLAEIGRGGMGVVYKALDTALDRQVALKVLPMEATSDPARLERFRREAKAVAALNHPGIVTIYSVEEAEGIHFLTMELVSGKTLHELIPEGGLPLERIFQVAIPLAESHASRGLALSLSQEYAAAQEFETAIRLDPRLFEAYYFYARNCFAQGLREQAAHLFEQAMEVRPEDYQSPAILRGLYLTLGRKNDVARITQKKIELVEAQLEANPDDVRALYVGAGALVASGQKEKGFEWARRAVAVDPTDTGTLYNKAVANGFAQKAWIEHDDDLASLRDIPRYKALLRRMN